MFSPLFALANPHADIMHTFQFQTPLTPGRVDRASATIYGVSIITSGLVARGHDLVVDEKTLSQMQSCAESKGQTPVAVDHRAGAASVCGFLTNYRRSGKKLVADWHLLKTHPLCDQILETAERMPSGVGLSAAFLPGDEEPGKARCRELVSVDYVALPAANPGGLFAAKPERRDILEKTGRVLDGGRVGAEVAGLVGGAAYVARRIAKAKRLPKITSPSFKRGLAGAVGKGAVIGGVAGAAYRIHRDRVDEARRFERQTIREILFEKATIKRIESATADELKKTELPGTDIVHAAKNRRVRSILWKGSKIAAGGLAGHLVGKRLGGKAGVIAGGIAGALLSCTSDKIIFMNSNHHREIARLVDRAAQPIRQGRSESHDLNSLSRRLFCTPAQAAELVDQGVLESLGRIHKDREDGPLGFSADEINSVQRSILAAVAEQVLEASDGADLNSLRLTIAQSLKEHKERTSKPAADTKAKAKAKEFARPEEERPGLLRKAAGVAAVGSLAYGAASALRGARTGRSILQAAKAGHRANVGDLRRAASVVRPGLSEITKKVLRTAGYTPV